MSFTILHHKVRSTTARTHRRRSCSIPASGRASSWGTKPSWPGRRGGPLPRSQPRRPPPPCFSALPPHVQGGGHPRCWIRRSWWRPRSRRRVGLRSPDGKRMFMQFCGFQREGDVAAVVELLLSCCWVVVELLLSCCCCCWCCCWGVFIEWLSL